MISWDFCIAIPMSMQISAGNGRMARLWHTAILAKWNPVFEFIPIESQIEKFQDDYYDAIAKCHVEGESTVFIEFMLTQIDNILEELLNQMTNSTTDDAILDADGANHGADNMEGSFVIYPYQEYKSCEMQIISKTR